MMTLNNFCLLTLCIFAADARFFQGADLKKMETVATTADATGTVDAAKSAITSEVGGEEEGVELLEDLEDYNVEEYESDYDDDDEEEEDDASTTQTEAAKKVGTSVLQDDEEGEDAEGGSTDQAYEDDEEDDEEDDDEDDEDDEEEEEEDDDSVEDKNARETVESKGPAAEGDGASALKAGATLLQEDAAGEEASENELDQKEDLDEEDADDEEEDWDPEEAIYDADLEDFGGARTRKRTIMKAYMKGMTEKGDVKVQDAKE